jgi:TonB family protein
MVVDDRLKLSGDSLQVAGEIGRQASVQSIYDAPEAAAGAISPAADVWGLGVTLVEALTQHPPAWDRAADEDPAVPESIPQPFAGIARGCLRADPMGRCTLGNVKTWLEAGQFHREPTVKIPEKKPVGNRVLVPVAAAIVLVAAIGVFIVHPHQGQPSSLAASTQADAQQQAPSVAPTPQPAQEQPPEAAASSPQSPEQAPAATPAPPPPQAPAPATQVSNGAAGNGAVAERVMPDVLPAARASIQGKVDVRVRVTVGPGGDVSDATFESQGPSRYFSKVALEAAGRWKFKPAQANGQATPSAWILQFQFTRDGTDVTPVAAH